MNMSIILQRIADSRPMWKKRGDISHCIRQISCLLTKLGLTKLQMWLFNLRVKFGRGLSKHIKLILATQVGENSLHIILYGRKHDSWLVILMSVVFVSLIQQVQIQHYSFWQTDMQCIGYRLSSAGHGRNKHDPSLNRHGTARTACLVSSWEFKFKAKNNWAVSITISRI